jgi:hypothetical protein
MKSVAHLLPPDAPLKWLPFKGLLCLGFSVVLSDFRVHAFRRPLRIPAVQFLYDKSAVQEDRGANSPKGLLLHSPFPLEKVPVGG